MSESSHMGMNDIRDDYSVEEKLITSVWVHDKHINGKTIDEIRMDFEARFGKKAPKHDAMIVWERNAFSTGSVIDSHSRHDSQTREQQQHHNRMHLESSSMMARSSRKPTSVSSYHPSLYKTELCRQYYEYGYCDYGERCLFAHGKYELKRIPNFKTKLCSSYHSSGYCSFGSRCAFIHKKREASERSDSTIRSSEIRSSRSIRPNRRSEPSRKKWLQPYWFKSMHRFFSHFNYRFEFLINH